MVKVEEYEWCRFWWDEADSNAKSRVLLIGDSIAEGYRPFVKNNMDNFLVDMLATSKGVDNGAYLHEIDYILGGTPYQYEVVHFNNGLHAMHLSVEEYSSFYKNVMRHILNKPCAKRLILALSTPVTEQENPDKLNEEKTRIISERNGAVINLAKQFDLQINDLFSKVIGKSEYRLDDGLHYTEEGQKIQALAVTEAIRSCLNTAD